jgi:hypothetical protein
LWRLLVLRNEDISEGHFLKRNGWIVTQAGTERAFTAPMIPMQASCAHGFVLPHAPLVSGHAVSGSLDSREDLAIREGLLNGRHPERCRRVVGLGRAHRNLAKAVQDLDCGEH